MRLKMASDSDIHSMPLSMIPYKTRQMLSCLLNSKKIIPSDGPDKLPRDWRGLASLVGIPSQEAAFVQQCSNKTDKVLDIWQTKDSPTVGKLLEYLQRLDRFDVHDDVLHDLREIARKDKVIDIGRQCEYEKNQIAVKNTQITINGDPYVHNEENVPQYDAFILYADEDQDFVNEIIDKLGDMFQLCTKDTHAEFLIGHSTEYAPIAELISKRCRYIVLVFSPAFLKSSANAFYRDYAQAVSIESRNRVIINKLIPIMYKECELPLHLKYYYCLRYSNSNSTTFNFWDKLKHSLRQHRVGPSIQEASSHQSGLNIVELSDTTTTQIDRISLNGQDSISAKSESSLISIGQNSDVVKTKKKTLGQRFRNVLQRKKLKKEKIAVPLSN